MPAPYTHTGRQATRTLIFLLILLAGCARLQVGQVFTPRSDDWLTFGRTPLRTSATDAPIALPLQQVWEYDLAAGTSNDAPVIADSIIMVGTMRGELHAVRLADGKRIGWISLGDAIHGTPVISGSRIIVPLTNSRESVVAFNLTEGAPQWKQTCGNVETSLLLTEGNLYGGTAEGSLFCLDAQTGKIRWTFSLPDNTARKGIRSTPLAWQSLVLFGADDGCLYALDAATGKQQWRYAGDAPIVAPPVADSTLLVVGTTRGRILALDPLTGTLRWRKEMGAPVYGHALLKPPVVVIATTSGRLAGLSALTGEQQWTTDIEGPVLAGPSAAGETLFVGTLRRDLLALSISDGKVLWKGKTEGRIKTSPVISSGMVIVTTDDRSMIAFRGGPKP
jgi:outer membrane protein assembly factor BamB